MNRSKMRVFAPMALILLAVLVAAGIGLTADVRPARAQALTVTLVCTPATVTVNQQTSCIGTVSPGIPANLTDVVQVIDWGDGSQPETRNGRSVTFPPHLYQSARTFPVTYRVTACPPNTTVGCLTGTGTAMVTVQGQTTMPPARFSGTVTLNGQPAPNGTTVQARVGNTVCGTGTVTAAGGTSTYVVDVASASTTPGCGTNGATVSFTVNGIAATQTGTFQAGGFIPLNLSAGVVQQVAPTVSVGVDRPNGVYTVGDPVVVIVEVRVNGAPANFPVRLTRFLNGVQVGTEEITVNGMFRRGGIVDQPGQVTIRADVLDPQTRAILASSTTAYTVQPAQQVTATATPFPTATPTPVPTASPTATPSPSPSATPSPTASPTVAPTATATAVPTQVRTATPTPTATATRTPTPTPTPAPVPQVDLQRLQPQWTGEVTSSGVSLVAGQTVVVRITASITNTNPFPVDLSHTFLIEAGDPTIFRSAVASPPEASRQDKLITWGGPDLVLGPAGSASARASIVIEAAVSPAACTAGQPVQIIRAVRASGIAAGVDGPLSTAEYPAVTTQVVSGLENGCVPVAAVGAVSAPRPAAPAPAPVTAPRPPAAPATALPRAGAGAGLESAARQSVSMLAVSVMLLFGGAALVRRTRDRTR